MNPSAGKWSLLRRQFNPETVSDGGPNSPINSSSNAAEDVFEYVVEDSFVQIEGQQDDFWSEEETLYLINLYSEHEDEMKHAKKKKFIWEIIGEKFMSQGFRKSPEKCRRKWINLCRVYRSVKDQGGPKKSGRGRSFYKYFHALDEVLGNRPSNSNSNCTIDVGSSTGEVTELQTAAVDVSDTEVQPNYNSTEELASNTEEIEVSNVKGKKRKNFTQEYFKSKINANKVREEERAEKKKRHDERMEIEKKKMQLEEQKIELLRKLLDIKERNS